MSILHGANNTLQSICSYLDRHVIERQLRKMGVGHANRIFTHTKLSELHALYKLTQGCPNSAKVLEIGSYLGASTCYVAVGVAQKNGVVYCVDTWMNETMPEGERDTFAEFQRNTKPIEPWLQIIRRRSELLVDEDFKKPLDFIFIDGNHSYGSVRADFQRVSRWLSVDGVIAFHDFYYYQGVSQVIGEALANGLWVLSGCVENLCWIKRAPYTWAMTE